MRREPDADRDAKHAGVPLRRVRAVEELGRLFWLFSPIRGCREALM